MKYDMNLIFPWSQLSTSNLNPCRNLLKQRHRKDDRRRECGLLKPRHGNRRRWHWRRRRCGELLPKRRDGWGMTWWSDWNILKHHQNKVLLCFFSWRRGRHSLWEDFVSKGLRSLVSGCLGVNEFGLRLDLGPIGAGWEGPATEDGGCLTWWKWGDIMLWVPTQHPGT